MTSRLSIKGKELESPGAAKLKAQLHDFLAFFEEEINLERNGGALKETTCRTLSKHVRRFMGFANKALSVPLDLRCLGDGVFIAQYIKLLQERKPGNPNHSYLEATLRHIQKLLHWLQRVDPVKRVGLESLMEGVENFIKQLHKGSAPPLLNTHDLVEDGTAVEYEELVLEVRERADELLGAISVSVPSASKLQDVLLATLLTQLPAQRTQVYSTLQIVEDKADLTRPLGNYIYFSEKSQAWRFKINEHKMQSRYDIPEFEIPSDSPLSSLLNHWTAWGEDILLVEELGCNVDTDGCAFFSAKGVPYTVDAFYSKIKSLFKVMCKNEKLNIGARVLRHLLADSELYSTENEAQKTSVAFLAGHSKHTEEKSYKSPTPSSKQLTSAANWCFEKQKEAMLRRREAQIAAKSLVALGEVEGHLESPQLKRGNQHVSRLPKLSKDEVLSMSLKEKRVAFEELYGVATESGNQEWLFSKLTGLSRDDYVSPKKRQKRETIDSDSENELDELM
jgi:hypothetical protein